MDENLNTLSPKNDFNVEPSYAKIKDQPQQYGPHPAGTLSTDVIRQILLELINRAFPELYKVGNVANKGLYVGRADEFTEIKMHPVGISTHLVISLNL